MPALRAIIRDAGKNNLRLSSFVLGIVNSAAFRMAKPAEPSLTATDSQR
jgi:hypothetical protein